MNTNRQLQDVYEHHWDALQANLKPLNPNLHTNPLLITFDEKKLGSSNLRVMIFGQETKGWGKLSPPNQLENVIKIYREFFSEGKFYDGYRKSSFWKAFRFFENGIRESARDKTVYFCWNNISKIGQPKPKTGVSKEVRRVERQHFSVIKQEVDLFQPDIVIFLTGPNRDGDIKHHFKDAEFLPIDTNIGRKGLVKVKANGLPERTVRLYHPSYFGGYYRVRDMALKQIIGAS